MGTRIEDVLSFVTPRHNGMNLVDKHSVPASLGCGLGGKDGRAGVQEAGAGRGVAAPMVMFLANNVPRQHTIQSYSLSDVL